MQYFITEPDRDGQWDTLPEEDILLIEPHLLAMVRRALRRVNVDISGCTLEAHCRGTNLARDRGTSDSGRNRWTV